MGVGVGEGWGPGGSRGRWKGNAILLMGFGPSGHLNGGRQRAHQVS